LGLLWFAAGCATAKSQAGINDGDDAKRKEAARDQEEWNDGDEKVLKQVTKPQRNDCPNFKDESDKRQDVRTQVF